MRQGIPLLCAVRLSLVLLGILAACAIVSPVYAAETSRVEETAAIVVGDQPIPAIVRERMERTVAAIAAERMEGRILRPGRKRRSLGRCLTVCSSATQ